MSVALDSKPDEPSCRLQATPTLSTPRSAVYLTYDIHNPPPHPGAAWTRFVCISDTHSKIFPVPPGDVLLHAGDLSSRGTLRHLRHAVEWLQSLPHPIKIMVAGNHDLCLDEHWVVGGKLYQCSGNGIPAEDIAAARAMVHSDTLRQAGLHYLEHESIRITVPNGRTWEIYGSPAARRYSLGAFQYKAGVGTAIYSRIPSTTEILITHSPPYGVCDLTRRGQNAGCQELAARLESRHLCTCRLHVFGHIHEAHGVALGMPTAQNPCGRLSVNAALHHVGQAVIVDLLN
ncbi:Metallo-dependent phosphatase [Sparassis latifolia]|uniref:Metallo-dependent phosphatase n=1 Tax=Sparassis crispa TaxID=139825 RepID=A0A401GI86_9APHY|nr:Metallo-dependent phosphatase [Sparassis crispa]GBE81815.1 Metallo-dependent phosphatase [Sparassis crispa]